LARFQKEADSVQRAASERGVDVVERYLNCMAAHDWDGLGATIADQGLTRDGPFCDRIEGKDAYVAFLRNVIPSLKNYELKVQRVSQVSDRVSFVELSETFEVDGVLTKYPECILFERNDDDLISHVSVFMKQPGADAPVEGARAT
jgi:limonene-1,2-epoxide hydrolase